MIIGSGESPLNIVATVHQTNPSADNISIWLNNILSKPVYYLPEGDVVFNNITYSKSSTVNQTSIVFDSDTSFVSSMKAVMINGHKFTNKAKVPSTKHYFRCNDDVLQLVGKHQQTVTFYMLRY